MRATDTFGIKYCKILRRKVKMNLSLDMKMTKINSLESNIIDDKILTADTVLLFPCFRV